MQLSKNLKYLSDGIWKDINEDNKSYVSFYLKSKWGASADVIRQYESALRNFLYFVYKYCDNVDITTLKKRNLLEYQNWLLEQKLGLSSIKFKRSAVSCLFDCIEEYYSDEHPDFTNQMKAIPMPIHEFVVQKVYVSDKEMQILREELIEKKKYKQLAFAEISHCTGLTKDELLALTKDIVDINHNAYGEYPLYVNNKKYYLNEYCMFAIRNWLSQRGEDDNQFLFVALKNNVYEQLNPTVFNYWCTSNFSKILGREIKPHLFFNKN